MAEALYRKYRPQQFSDVVDQQHIRTTLEHALEQDRVAQAYIFAGPRGVGKTTMARLLARAVNCTNRKGAEPCTTCPSCTAILHNQSLDIIEIDAASQTGVDNVRDNIIQAARTAPSIGQHKVFIIDEVHMLSIAAFNALLKILEEPPSHAMFILATTELHRIPETIISRSQRFDFKKISATDIATRIRELARSEGRDVEPAVAERIARFARGSVRDAESILGQLLALKQKKITTELADAMLPRVDTAVAWQVVVQTLSHRPAEAIRQFHLFCDGGGDVAMFLDELLVLGRAVVLGGIDPDMVRTVLAAYDQETISAVQAAVPSFEPDEALAWIDACTTARRQIQYAPIAELPVEVAIATIGTRGTQIAVATPVPAPTVLSPTPMPVAESISQATPDVAPKKITKPRGRAGSINVAAAETAWLKLKSAVGRKHPSLGLSIQHGSVTGYENEVIQLTVPFKLHADRLTDPKHAAILQQELSELIGANVRVEVRHDPTIVPPAPPPVIESATPAAPTAVGPAPTKTVAKPAPVVGSGNELWDQVVASFS